MHAFRSTLYVRADVTEMLIFTAVNRLGVNNAQSSNAGFRARIRRSLVSNRDFGGSRDPEGTRDSDSLFESGARPTPGSWRSSGMGETRANCSVMND